MSINGVFYKSVITYNSLIFTLLAFKFAKLSIDNNRRNVNEFCFSSSYYFFKLQHKYFLLMAKKQ